MIADAVVPSVINVLIYFFCMAIDTAFAFWIPEAIQTTLGTLMICLKEMDTQQ